MTKRSTDPIRTMARRMVCDKSLDQPDQVTMVNALRGYLWRGNAILQRSRRHKKR